MTINWLDFPSIIHRTKLHKAVSKFITRESYEQGKWNLTDVIADDDPRKFVVYEVLEGIQADRRTKRPDLAPRIDFKFEVLTRQACCRDKHGNTLWQNKEAMTLYGEPDDLLPEYNEKPKPGDVVEWKGHAITVDPDNDNPVDAKTLKKWARMGKRPNEYKEYVVDADGCITVWYPQCLEMLSRKGFRGAKPQFRKTHIKDKTRRRMTNWWFKEVDPSKPRRKKRSDAGKPRGTNPEPADANATE